MPDLIKAIFKDKSLRGAFIDNTDRVSHARLKILILSTLLVLSVLFNTIPSHANPPIFIASNAPPSGFESLIQPQTTAVDIYYGNHYLLTSLATFTPTRIEFHHPDQILQFIPDLLEPGRVLNKLRTPLDIHSELVCGRTNQDRCGTLEADVVDVIFDSGKFRVDLFINPTYLVVRDAISNPLLPESTSGTSFIQLINGSFSGQDDSAESYTISGVSTLGRRQSRLQSSWASTDANSLNIDTLFWRSDYEGYDLQAGLIRTSGRGLTFTSQQDITGISATTSLITRTDLAYARGSEIQLFLNSRSRVEIFKDDRLVDTRFYDIGNQSLDTSRLPNGAYDIVLRIRDSSGSQREENHFFVKSPKLPPRDAPQYFVHFGKLFTPSEADLFPNETPSWVFRSGYAKRINDTLGGEIALLSTQGQSLVETSVFWFGQGYDLQSSLMTSTQGDFGLAFNSQYRLGVASIGYNYRRIWADQEFDFQGDDTQNQVFLQSASEQRFDPVPNSTLQSTLSLNVLVGQGNLGLQSSYSHNQFEDKRTSYSLRYQRPLFRSGPYQLNVSTHLGKDDDEYQALLGLSLRHSTKHLSNTLNARYASEKDAEESSSGIAANARTTWNDKDLYEGDLQGSLRANKDLNESNLGAEIEYNSRLGHSRFAVEESRTADDTTLQYGGNLAFSLIAAKDLFAFGGKQQSTGAAVINIEGQASETKFDIYVNGQRRGEAIADAKTVLSLAPYQSYKVRLRPTGAGFISFNDEVKTITIYPGNVEQLTWEIQDLVVIFGRVFGADGKPLANARITGALGLATSDDIGLFQAEIKKNTQAIIFQTLTHQCKIDTRQLSIQQGIANLGNITCLSAVQEEKPLNDALAPSPIKPSSIKPSH
ncbi:MAG: hypothetical protein COB04_18485 [Gammaproteobacteria bacterium]|nr:MAG: hypothetical protein COB04_18485 [Gammaproteobacteria bacterium]